MKKITFMLAVCGAIALAACETTSSQPYKASTNNIVEFQKVLGASGKKVNLGDFQTAAGVDTELSCRALGAIEVAPGKSPLEFIKEAMQEELFAAGVYDPSAASTITGEITQFEADSYGTGKWEIAMTLRSQSLPQGLSVSTKYEFKSSFSALSACQNVTDAFTPSVQDLIGKAVKHPDFAKLAQ